MSQQPSVQKVLGPGRRWAAGRKSPPYQLLQAVSDRVEEAQLFHDLLDNHPLHEVPSSGKTRLHRTSALANGK